MGDFVSQATIDEGHKPVPDALGHDATALAILHKAVFLPPGSVIAVQGSWGRGKTDVLLRVAALIRDAEQRGLPKGLLTDALWINPWQYGTPDLLTPLVFAMLGRFPEAPRRDDKRLRKLAETLLRAGVNFGLKAFGKLGVIPFGDLAADPVDKMLISLFDTSGDPDAERPDPDPVAVMGERFRELAHKLLQSKQLQPDARLLVCVDDLDRCLPDRQVALLEAIRFLISTGAPVTFLIALDPTLARQAIITHYSTEAFDPDRYLDKMFDLRVNLPSLGPRLADLVRFHLSREVHALGATMKIGDAMKSLLGNNAPALLETVAVRALNSPDLANPRIVRRIFDRLYLLAVSQTQRAAGATDPRSRPPSLQGEQDFRLLLVWLAIIERFPAVRAAVQAASQDQEGSDQFTKRLLLLQQTYSADAPAPEMAALMKSTLPAMLAAHRLPQPTSAPELTAIFAVLRSKDGSWADVIRNLDEALVLAGL